MKKYIAVLLLLVLGLAGCTENVVLDEIRAYTVNGDVHSLEIQIGAADLNIRRAESFSMESNLKYLSVSEKNGVLHIIEDTKVGAQYIDPILTLYMPADTVLDNVSIQTGAAYLNAEVLSAKSLKLQLGAGDVNISKLDVQENANIEGGAGNIDIDSGLIRNLELTMGVGELDMTAALFGDSELIFGVGASDITLLGSRYDYELDIEKGLGSITVDSGSTDDPKEDGEGTNYVQIKGGIGSVNLAFDDGSKD